MSALMLPAARPILFSGPMIRALLAGHKTQTRRIAKEFEGRDDLDAILKRFPHQRGCPYGKPGDLLWIRESIMVPPDITPRMLRDGADTWPRCVYRADAQWFGKRLDLAYIAHDHDDEEWLDLGWKATPSIHMPRWASRLTLRITDVRVQRLQEISEEDAMAEGVRAADAAVVFRDGKIIRDLSMTARGSFCCLWESINGPGSWDANPWAWALTFEVIKANVDQVLAENGCGTRA